MIDAEQILYGRHPRQASPNVMPTGIYHLDRAIDAIQLDLPDFFEHHRGDQTWIGSNLSWAAKSTAAAIPTAWYPLLPFDEQSESYGEVIDGDWEQFLDALSEKDTLSLTDDIKAYGLVGIDQGLRLDYLQVQVSLVIERMASPTLDLYAPVHQLNAVEQLAGTGEWRYLDWPENDVDGEELDALVLFDHNQQPKGAVFARKDLL